MRREKIKLSNELKCFLTSALNVIIDATQKSFEQISNEYDGKFIGSRGQGVDENIIIYLGELTRIFPDEFKQMKERSLRIIDNYITHLNKILLKSEQIDIRLKDEFIDNIVQSNHELLLFRHNFIG